MRRVIFTVLVLICCVLSASAKEYTANDFDVLIHRNPIVIVGKMEVFPKEEQGDCIGLIEVERALKNSLKGVTLSKGDGVMLGPSPGNLSWSVTPINLQKGQVSIWVIKMSGKKDDLFPAEIVSQFILDETMLPKTKPGERLPPFQKWGQKEYKTSSWGVIRISEATCFNKEGKLLKKLPAGSLLEIIKRTKSSAGEVAVCKVMDGSEKPPDLVIKTEDMDMYAGDFSRASEEWRDLVVKHATLQADIEIEKAKVVQAMASKNPYGREYNKAKTVYKEYWAKVEDLTKKRDASKGHTHVKYGDQLRRMKGEDIRIGQAYKAAKEKYEKWMEKNSKGRLSSPALKRLEQEFAAVRKRLG